MPKVSVIMGVYNCKNKDWLIESVKSIINQAFTDWEFLICNDGSTDKTLDILYDIEKMDSRIQILSYEKNHGLAYALNYCLRYAKGQYIARQDDDDLSYISRLGKQVLFLDTHPEYSIVGAKADVFNEMGIWGEYSVEETPNKKSFFWNSPFVHPIIMMRKEDLIKVGSYRIAKETRRCEDYDLFMRMYSVGMKGYNIQEKLYKYRIENNPNKTYRPMRYRIDEAKVRLLGFKNMGILPKGIPYILKPIILGLIPAKLFSEIRKTQY